MAFGNFTTHKNRGQSRRPTAKVAMIELPSAAAFSIICRGSILAILAIGFLTGRIILS